MDSRHVATLAVLQSLKRWVEYCSDRIIKKRTIENAIAEIQRIADEDEVDRSGVTFTTEPDE